MKLNHFIKIFALMVFCSTFFVSEGKSYAPDKKSKHASFSHKLSPSDSFPGNAYLTINLLEGNQDLTQQVHKTTTSSHIAYLPPRTFNVYIAPEMRENRLRNCESKPTAAGVACPAFVGAIKTIKNTCEVFFRNTNAGVDHLDVRIFSLFRQPHRHVARHVLHRAHGTRAGHRAVGVDGGHPAALAGATAAGT